MSGKALKFDDNEIDKKKFCTSKKQLVYIHWILTE